MSLLEPGLLIDRYKIRERIGAGAMGDVYLAVDEGLGRKVALKILAEMHRENAELRARFVREARAVAAVSHPNVVQVFTTGEYDGRPFLAMEFLDGRDLGSLVKETGPLDSVTAADMIHQAASGLSAASHAGLIHRDVKPSNLMRLESGTVKVTDFGLAKPMDPEAGPALTAFGIVVGTPDYIAPEQARGEPIDHRVDIYALGCTLFYLLTGRPPFRKSTDADEKYIKVVARHLRDPVPDARDEVETVDAELALLQLQMMSKLAEQRPSYEELIKRTGKIRGRLQAGGSTPTPTPASVPAPASQTRSLVRRPAPAGEPEPEPASGTSSLPLRPRGSRWLVAVTALSVLVFLSGMGLLAFAPRRPAAGPAPAPDAAAPLADAAPPPPPKPPEGMLYVPPVEGKRGFFVDRLAVSNAAYAERTRGVRYPRALADHPVVNVSFAAAQAYAKARGKRLLSTDEWDRALAVPGFAPAGMRIWEWVDDGMTTVHERHVRKGLESTHRGPNAQKDVSFRLAAGPP